MGGTRRLTQSDPARGTLAGMIPSVDYAELAAGAAGRDVAVETIREACRSTGFFCLDNLLRRSASCPRVLGQMRRFFALPDDDARKLAIDVSGEENTHGWMPMFQEPAYQPGTVAHLESFDCGRPRQRADDRSNRWPALDGFRHDVRALWDELSDAGWTVLRALEDALGIADGFLVDRCHSQDLSTMRLLHYPAVDAARERDDSVGIAAHTDFECITFIMQTAPGLELMDVRGDWYDAPAGSDSVVVLLGDMLERWTNGGVRATGHRVRSREFERYSIVKFFAVNDEVTVAPLDAFVAASRPARYAPLGQREHTRAELARAEALRDEYAADRVLG